MTKKNKSLSRRDVMRGLGGGASFAAALGMPIPFLKNLGAGLSPIALSSGALTSGALAQGFEDPVAIKKGLTQLSDHPLNMETPPHLLDDAITPAARMFVRNNGQVPFFTEEDIAGWRLAIDGEVETPLDLSLEDLKAGFEKVTLALQIECAGNGRKFFEPGARGNQWSFGAISCAQWTGVRLADVLNRAGLKSSAVYTAHASADAHLSGDPEKQPISRGVPIAKALDPHTIIAFAMNGEDIPLLNGHPLRVVAPGWPGSCSQKWLTRINLRDRVHDGAKMTGQSYRVPAYPVSPGTLVPDEDMKIIEGLPVKSLITAPQTGARVRAGRNFAVRGAAWAGDLDVAGVDLSLDFGANWTPADLTPGANKYAWARWSAALIAPEPGYYEVWARARDENGVAQPATTPGWNPRGYLNNMQHRIAVFAQ